MRTGKLNCLFSPNTPFFEHPGSLILSSNIMPAHNIFLIKFFFLFILTLHGEDFLPADLQKSPFHTYILNTISY
jgi:hypothetical protein